MSCQTYRRAAVLAAIALTATACAAPAAPPTSGTPAAPAATASTTETSRFNTRCAGEATASFGDLLVEGPGARISGGTLGEGATAAVLLHQAQGPDSCGWAPFAQALAAEGVRAVVIEHCGVGLSECRDPTNYPAMVRPAVDWARAHGATRVVLVGASAGGSIAANAAPAVGADAVVDLSGPIRWNTADLRRDAALLTMPTLLVYADRPDADRAAGALAAKLLPQVPAADKRLLTAPGGHGYALVEPDAPTRRAVLDWIAGRYS